MTWEIVVRHDGLGKYRLIRGQDRMVAEAMAQAQLKAWEGQWTRRQEAEGRRLKEQRARQQEAERRRRERDSDREAQARLAAQEKDRQRQETQREKDEKAAYREARIAEAAEATNKVRAEIASIHKLLTQGPMITAERRWNALKDTRPFLEQPPKLRLAAFPASASEERRAAIEQQNAATIRDHQYAMSKFRERECAFRAAQAATDAIDNERVAYFSGEPGAIIKYCEMVLSGSEYPNSFPREWDVEYQAETKILLVDYHLPGPDLMPQVLEVKYIHSLDEMKEIFIPPNQRDALYDDAIYQISLRTIAELFAADEVKAVDAVVFNGYVTTIERAKGKMTTTCVVSVQAGRDEFLSINLEEVDAKACFHALRGIGSAKLHGITAIAPIAKMNKDDRRFIEAYDVATHLDVSVNLAAMDWQDFEHLIREVFEQEFAANGGEVKVTQASRDGGVDAVAFDPDPIRGGKIVIQAKRYTNTVGVSAVRDLFGTVMNEGATKGILVTTSNYGPDAYDFAKGKPLTLLNGSNLLHLLEKHGHRARIDLKEAKRQPSETDSTD